MSEQYFVKQCFDCGGSTTVIDSREKEYGAVWRKRKCTDCGYTFTTIEIEDCMADDLNLLGELTELRKQIKKLKNMIMGAKNILDDSAL